MCDRRGDGKDFIIEFIEMYQSLPCLWKVKSKEYRDSVKKADAYEALANKLKEVEADANKDLVVKKINSLRCCYRKEHKKVLQSIRSGARDDDVYRPRLWYYDLLEFLSDQGPPRATSSNIEECEDFGFSGSESSPETMQHEYSPSTDIGLTSSSPTLSSRCTCATSHMQRPKRKWADTSDSVLSIIGERVASSQPEDGFDIFGKHVARKLRGIPKEQRIYAEKLITDVMFEAELGNLNRKCTLVKDSQPEGS